MAEERPLPEFDNPPVSEVALSVQFQPLAGWRGPHAGLYWARIAADYPDTEVHPAIGTQIERFGPDFWQTLTTRFEVADPDLARFWFLARPPTHLVQVQRDRFIVNWRKVQGDEDYPRYERIIRPRFVQEWNRFKAFVSELQLGEIDVRQCEVTYVNDVPQGQGWESIAGINHVLSIVAPQQSGQFLPPMETVALSGSFEMPDERGRLHFNVQHRLRTSDQKEVVQLRLTARGRPNSSSDAEILAWMDLGRKWIVQGFVDMTASEAQRLWGRTR